MTIALHEATGPGRCGIPTHLYDAACRLYLDPGVPNGIDDNDRASVAALCAMGLGRDLRRSNDTPKFSTVTAVDLHPEALIADMDWDWGMAVRVELINNNGLDDDDHTELLILSNGGGRIDKTSTRGPSPLVRHTLTIEHPVLDDFEHDSMKLVSLTLSGLTFGQVNEHRTTLWAHIDTPALIWPGGQDPYTDAGGTRPATLCTDDTCAGTPEHWIGENYIAARRPGTDKLTGRTCKITLTARRPHQTPDNATP